MLTGWSTSVIEITRKDPIMHRVPWSAGHRCGSGHLQQGTAHAWCPGVPAHSRCGECAAKQEQKQTVGRSATLTLVPLTYTRTHTRTRTRTHAHAHTHTHTYTHTHTHTHSQRTYACAGVSLGVNRMHSTATPQCKCNPIASFHPRGTMHELTANICTHTQAKRELNKEPHTPSGQRKDGARARTHARTHASTRSVVASQFTASASNTDQTKAFRKSQAVLRL